MLASHHMPALHIRNLDDAVIAALKARAVRNGRSLQGEARRLLEAAAADRPSRRQGGRRLRLRVVSVGRVPSYSRAVIYGDDDR
jgi:plasmid stability protein